MNKREFVKLLSEALEERVPAGLIREKLEYYRTYISEQVRETGQDEEDVIASLGTPESIARTIVDTYERTHGSYVGAEDVEEATVEENGSSAGRGFFSILEGKGCLIALVIGVIFLFALGSWVLRILVTCPWLVIVIIAVIVVGWKRNGGGPLF